MKDQTRAGLTAVVRGLVYVAISLALSALAFQLSGYDAGDILTGIVDGSITQPGALAQTLRWMFPLLLVALGVAVSFRAGYFNIGAQGQLYAGAICAQATVTVTASWPAPVAIVLTFAAGTIGGALWAAWPGLLRIVWGTDEVITTLMGNFIAVLLLSYVTSGPLKDPAGSAQATASRPVPDPMRIGDGFTLSPTILAVTAAVCVAVWWVLNRTSFGVASGLAGRNPVMMLWQGARLNRLGLHSFLIGGALAGLAGATEILGPTGRLVSGMDGSIGFTAVTVALVGGLTVFGTVVAAFFFGALAASGLFLPLATDLPSAAVDIINAMVALLITSTFVLRFRRRRASSTAAAAGGDR